MNNDTLKQQICDALAAWIRQRPDLEPRNYFDPHDLHCGRAETYRQGVASYRAEQRSIARDKRDAETLLQAVRWHDGITAEDLLQAAKHAFSGRLTIADPDGSGVRIDYCTGQYWPTEYRKAAAAVLASALWEYTRSKAMPQVTGYRVDSWMGENGREKSRPFGARAEAEIVLAEKGGQQYGSITELYNGESAGEWVRHSFRKEFGSKMQKRWFD